MNELPTALLQKLSGHLLLASYMLCHVSSNNCFSICLDDRQCSLCENAVTVRVFRSWMHIRLLKEWKGRPANAMHLQPSVHIICLAAVRFASLHTLTRKQYVPLQLTCLVLNRWGWIIARGNQKGHFRRGFDRPLITPYIVRYVAVFNCCRR